MSERFGYANRVHSAAFSPPPNGREFCANSKHVNRRQLEHIIRAAAANANTTDIVVIGSQAILGSYPDAPEELTRSIEADVFPKDKPADSILIDGAMGERSIFHETFGYYAHGVDETTATLPAEWQSRLVPITGSNTAGATGWCLEVHDLAVAKLSAGRAKDLDYVEGLLRHGFVRPEIVRQRLELAEFKSGDRETAEDRLVRLVARVR